MLFDEFAIECMSFWEGYLNFTQKGLEEGYVVTSGKILFPTSVLFSKFDDHYVMEFFGASRRYDGLRYKKNKVNGHVQAYFELFGKGQSDGIFNLAAPEFYASDIAVAYEPDIPELTKRFPFFSSFGTKFIQRFGNGSLISFEEGFGSACFERCCFISRNDNFYRGKNISFCFIATKDIKKSELKQAFRNLVDQRGPDGGYKSHVIHTIGLEESELEILISQLQALYLFSGIRETTIGDFLNANPLLISRAFQTEKFQYEPHLNWIEHDGTIERSAINPDLMIRRSDGFYDIVDLKLALLDKTKIVRRGRERRTFIDSVHEGIAQLQHYKEYFTYEANRRFAKENFGIEVLNPKITLIVGNIENSDAQEISQAVKTYADVTILNYDLFVSSMRAIATNSSQNLR